MTNLRRSIKAYLLALVVFFILTLILAVLIKFTGFDEDWSGVGLMIILGLISLMIGYLEGRIFGSKGLLTGLLSAALLLFVILIVLNLTLKGAFSIGNTGMLLPINLLLGAIGGVVGANSDK